MDARLRGRDVVLSFNVFLVLEDKMEISLRWFGPFSYGNFGEVQKLSAPRGPHVYVRVETFSAYKIVAAGKASNLDNRMSRHLTDFLGHQYYLSDDDNAFNDKKYGLPAGNAGLGIYDKLDMWIETAIQEVRRFSFFAAPCPKEYLAAVEAELIVCCKKIVDLSKGALVTDNHKFEKRVEGTTLKHEFDSEQARGVLPYIQESSANA